MKNTEKPTLFDMVILGGGPAGFTAALYAARAGLSALVLEQLSPGGQMALSHQIDNYPGFEDGIDGFTLAQKMESQALRFGAAVELAEVRAVDLSSNPKVIQSSEGTFYGKTVVIATGAVPRTLGLPEEQALTGRGLHYCAACDGMFYRGKTVVVVGGGNSAAADALLLSRVAKKVVVVHRRDTLRAEKIYHAPLMDAENVEFRWNSEAVRFSHGDRLTGIRIRNKLSGTEEEIPCDGVFISVGRRPATTLFEGQLNLDEQGYLVADETTATELPGVYAVGDVRTKPVRQVVTAVADGAVAVHMAESPVACLAAVHAAAAMHNCLALEFHSVDVPWWADIVTGIKNPLFENGFITVPEKPGLGFDDLNEEMIREHINPQIPGYFEPTDEWNTEFSNDRIWS